MLKRLEIFGFVEFEEEPRFTRERSRKFYRLTSSGIEYFTSLLGSDEDNAESRAPTARGVTKGRWHE